MSEQSSVQVVEIDHFQVRGKLARGGMGIVYLAYEPDLDRKVALKFLSPELSRDERIRERFAREAKAAASLQHPNIVSIFFRGTYKGQPYFAMELIEGKSLEDMAKQGPLLPPVAIDYMLQCCKGLAAAWQKGRVHRDIKPGNIMVTQSGIVKITDFGLAKALDKESGLTSANMVVGTPDYISPEQAQGDAVDCRSDIYSLGATFYFLLSGHRPFVGDSAMGVLVKHISAPLTPLAEKRGSIPRPLCDVIERMLAKKPEERQQTYGELINALEAIDLSLYNSAASGETVVQGSSPVFVPDPGSGETVAGLPSAVSSDNQAASAAEASRPRQMTADASSPTVESLRPETKPAVPPPEPAPTPPPQVDERISQVAPKFELEEKKSSVPWLSAIGVLLLIVVVFYLGRQTGKSDLDEPTPTATVVATALNEAASPSSRDLRHKEMERAEKLPFLDLRAKTSYLFIKHVSGKGEPIEEGEISRLINDFDMSLHWDAMRFDPQTVLKLEELQKLIGYREEKEKEKLEEFKKLEQGLSTYRLRYPITSSTVQAFHSILKDKAAAKKRLTSLADDELNNMAHILDEELLVSDPKFLEEEIYHVYDTLPIAMRGANVNPEELQSMVHKKRAQLVDPKKLRVLEMLENGAAQIWHQSMKLIDGWKGDEPLDDDFLNGFEGDFDLLENAFFEGSPKEAAVIIDRFRKKLDKVAAAGQVTLPFCDSKKPFNEWLKELPPFEGKMLDGVSLRAYVNVSRFIASEVPVPSLEVLPEMADEGDVRDGLSELNFTQMGGASFFDVKSLICFSYMLLHAKGARGRLEKFGPERMKTWGALSSSYKWPFCRANFEDMQDSIDLIRTLRVDLRPFMPLLYQRRELEKSLITFSLAYTPRPKTIKALRNCIQDKLPEMDMLPWEQEAIQKILKTTSGWRSRGDIRKTYQDLFIIMRLAGMNAFEIEESLREYRTKKEGDEEERWHYVERAVAYGWYVAALLLTRSDRKDRAVDVVLGRNGMSYLPAVGEAFRDEVINTAESASRDFLAFMLERAKSKGLKLKDDRGRYLKMPPIIERAGDNERFFDYLDRLPSPRDEDIDKAPPHVLIKLMNLVEPQTFQAKRRRQMDMLMGDSYSPKPFAAVQQRNAGGLRHQKRQPFQQRPRRTTPRSSGSGTRTQRPLINQRRPSVPSHRPPPRHKPPLGR